uniref:Uncharacterized protein n=1 Tax=Salmo trutta TaxID=8032 RepID=A0A674EC48_SALTR
MSFFENLAVRLTDLTTKCNHASPGPTYPASSPAGSSEAVLRTISNPSQEPLVEIPPWRRFRWRKIHSPPRAMQQWPWLQTWTPGSYSTLAKHPELSLTAGWRPTGHPRWAASGTRRAVRALWGGLLWCSPGTRVTPSLTASTSPVPIIRTSRTKNEVMRLDAVIRATGVKCQLSFKQDVYTYLGIVSWLGYLSVGKQTEPGFPLGFCLCIARFHFFLFKKKTILKIGCIEFSMWSILKGTSFYITGF